MLNDIIIPHFFTSIFKVLGLKARNFGAAGLRTIDPMQ